MRNPPEDYFSVLTRVENGSDNIPGSTISTLILKGSSSTAKHSPRAVRIDQLMFVPCNRSSLTTYAYFGHSVEGYDHVSYKLLKFLGKIAYQDPANREHCLSS